MSVQAIINLGSFPQGYCWSGPQQYAQDLVNILQILFPGTFNSFNYGNAVPDPADQDKPWFRLNPDGTPDKWYVYVGAWISPNPRSASSMERMIWKDTEANLWAYDGGDGTDPGTSPPTDTTGAMWQRDTDFDFKFPVGIGTNGTAYDGNPANAIAIGDVGGEERHVLDTGELPAHDHHTGAHTYLLVPPYVGSVTGSDTVNSGSEQAVGPGDGAAISSVGSGLSHQNMPPYRGVIYAKRTARKFYTV